MNTKIVLFGALSVMLASCGGGVSTPQEVRGAWGPECGTPTLRIDESSLHILYPQKEDFDLTAAEFDGKTLKLSLENDGKKITDVYSFANNTLTPEQVIVDGASFSANKQPMNKCS